jgi:putative oxidoreductase
MKFNKDTMTSLGLLWLRVLAGAGILHHGYQKLFLGQIDLFAQGLAKDHVPLPLIAAWAAALSEFLGGFLIVAGLKTRVGAFFVFVTMSVAIFVHHAHDPLQVKELAYAYWTASGALILAGSGRFGLDKG